MTKKKTDPILSHRIMALVICTELEVPLSEDRVKEVKDLLELTRDSENIENLIQPLVQYTVIRSILDHSMSKNSIKR